MQHNCSLLQPFSRINLIDEKSYDFRSQMLTNTSGSTNSYRAPISTLLHENKSLLNQHSFFSQFPILHIRNLSPFLPLPDVTSQRENTDRELRCRYIYKTEFTETAEFLPAWLNYSSQLQFCCFSQFKYYRIQCWDWHDSALLEILADSLHSSESDCQKNLQA